MTRSFGIALTAVLALGTLAYAQGGLNEERPSGTFSHQLSLGAYGSLPAIVTLHADHTVIVAGSIASNGPIHGVWRMTGPKSIGATTIFFIFDGNGNLTGYQRNRCTLQFAADFETYQGNEFMETASCSPITGCPDPLDSETTWSPLAMMPEDGFSVSGRRLQWLLAGPLSQ